MIDKTCLVGGTKAVVDIDDRDAAGAGIEHGEQCCHAAKACTVATLVGTAMTGQLTRPPMTLRQGAFHAGDGDDHLCLGKFLGMSEQAVQAGDATS